MAVTLLLRNGKYIFLNTDNYEISTKMFQYADRTGTHSIPYEQIEELTLSKTNLTDNRISEKEIYNEENSTAEF